MYWTKHFCFFLWNIIISTRQKQTTNDAKQPSNNVLFHYSYPQYGYIPKQLHNSINIAPNAYPLSLYNRSEYNYYPVNKYNQTTEQPIDFPSIINR